MKDYINLLKREQIELDKVIEKIRASLSNVPEGKLRVAHSNGTVQYYKRTSPGDMTGTYIKKKDIAEVKALAQKEYDRKMLSVYEKKRRIIDEFIQKYEKTDAENRYKQMNKDRKMLINPYEVDDETYRTLWESVKYQGKMFEEGQSEIFTEKGERVRSKSEKLIADKLYLLDVPYRYEYPIKIHGLGIVYPDFILLNVKKRKEYILEHFGMMDNAEYCEKAIFKINCYEKSGIFLGDKLMTTFETSNMPIDMRNFEKRIIALMG